jgi:hypothetical protein
MPMKERFSSTGVKAGIGEAAPGIEHAAGQGHQRHEQDVGEGDAGQLDGELELAGIGRKARGRDVDDQPVRCDDAEDGDDPAPPETGRWPRDRPGRWVSIFAAFVLVLGQDGNEGLRESALGKHAGAAGWAGGRRRRRRRSHAGAKGAGDHEVAHEAQDARQQGHAADGGEGAEQIHAFSCAPGTGALLRVQVPP